MSKLFENQNIRIATLAVVIVFISAFVAGEVAWKTNIHRDIKELKSAIQTLNSKIVGKTPNGWHRNDMMLWQLETEKLNPGWKGGSTKYQGYPMPHP